MTGTTVIEQLATIATIAAPLVAGGGFIFYKLQRLKKRWRLEKYLQQVKQESKGDDKGRRTSVHLMAALGMSEAEILETAFGSSKIKRTTATDPKSGHASKIYFEYRV